MKKVLWIVNILLKPISSKLLSRECNGLWIEALLDNFKNNEDFQIIVATTANVKKTVCVEEEGIKYYALPNAFPTLYNENKQSNINAWKKLYSEEKPDLIQIWGTEFTHGLCALRCAEHIPVVIYMQGYIGSISKHYLAGMTHKELKKSLTLRDIVKRDSIVMQQEKYRRQAEKEKEMFHLSGRIIVENEWCKLSVKSVCPNIEFFRCPLSVNRVFSNYKWDISKVEKHSIICNASGYPLKGLHMMLRAIKLLKDEYPDVKLYIPGSKVVSDGSVIWFLRKRGYTKYIEKLIKRLGIENNVVWIGNIKQEELAKYYQKTSVFVLCSAIENHSSSLKEAMIVGVPCVASAVGGIPEYVKNGENGFLYRFEEYEIMAGYIKRLFEDDELAIRISNEAKKRLKKLHSGSEICKLMSEIYNCVLEGKQCMRQ